MGQHLRGPVRVGRDRPRSICRLDLADGALPQRAGIAGLSMGGYGAVNIALRHLNLFSVVESWSGYFTQTPTGPFAGATPAALRANSPAAYVHTLWSQLTADPIHVLLYISRTDPLRVQQGPFAAALGSLGVPVERMCSAAPTTSLSGRSHVARAGLRRPLALGRGALTMSAVADRPGAGARASLAQGARVSVPAPERRRAAAGERPPPAPHPVLDAALALVAGRAPPRDRRLPPASGRARAGTDLPGPGVRRRRPGARSATGGPRLPSPSDPGGASALSR